MEEGYLITPKNHRLQHNITSANRLTDKWSLKNWIIQNNIIENPTLSPVHIELSRFYCVDSIMK